ncbi:MAG: hypothetical protein KAU50_00070 [Candidatus Marinimicrobia bacterium]|nr:hypothetical protein [Candidatus Neomarinimicrobiota bacterium]
MNRSIEEISGRGVSKRSVAALTQLLSKAETDLEEELAENLQLADKYHNDGKANELDLKALKNDLALVNGEKRMNVSLIHKRVGGSSYIKARGWWHGKQREVQIGSIPLVLGHLRKSLGMKLADTGMDWIKIKENDAITSAIKELGRIKLRDYIVRRLVSQYVGMSNESDIVEGLHDAGFEEAEVSFRKNDPGDSTGDWYEQWGRENS